MPALDGHLRPKQLNKRSTLVNPPYEQLKHIQSIPEIKKSVTGTRKALIILADFPDYTWQTQQDSNFINPINEPGFEGLYQTEYYEDMLFSLNSFRDPFSQSTITGSMRDFYLENSYGQFDIDGVVTAWYTVSKPFRYYANNDSLPNTSDDYGFGGGDNSVRTFIHEVIALADADIDFSEFDEDSDNIVDALFIVHAGPGAEELYIKNYDAHFNYFWSHQSSVSYQTSDGVAIGRYTVEPQNGTIGVFCHEYGHVLGLPDLYSRSRPVNSEGIGEWGLMASGGWCHLPGNRPGTSPAHYTAWAKMRLGWLQPVQMRSGIASMRLAPVEKEPVAVQVWNDVMSTKLENPTEYFLLENRQNILFDAGLTRRQVDFDRPLANGLIIYHVNTRNYNNDQVNRRLIDVEEASPVFTNGKWIENLDMPRDLSTYQFLDTGNRGDDGDPFPGYFDWNEDMTSFFGLREKNEFTDLTIPNSKTNAGDPTLIAIENIRIDGEDVLFDLQTNQVQTSALDGEKPTQPNSFTFSVYPNPMKDASQFLLRGNFEDSNLLGEIRIYNILGQLIHHFDFTASRSDGKLLFWHGRNSLGRKVQSGIYFVVASYGSFTETKKLIITL